MNGISSPDAPYIEGLRGYLEEVSGSEGLDLEFDFGNNEYLTGDSNAPSVSCRSYRRAGGGRIMSLTVTLFDGFEQLPLSTGKMPLTLRAKKQIADAIRGFWGAGDNERHIRVVVPQPPLDIVTEANYR